MALPDGSIRLMHLTPSPNDRDEICAWFSIVRLDTRPRYEALSYVWGSRSDHLNPKIQTEAGSKPVTDNLHSALRHLRLRDNDRVLWVDALCIDQADPLEKQRQVLHMKDIYADATNVIVWLGESSKSSGTAFELLRAIAEDSSLHFNPSRFPHVTINGMSLQSSDLCQSLAELFARDWWKRTWTVQEFVLASQLTFQCGHDTLSRDEMYLAERHFANHFDVCCQPHETWPGSRSGIVSVLQGFAAFDLLKTTNEHRSKLTRPYSVLSAISSFRGREVSDLHDRIYGVLGLGTQDYENLVPADYTLSLEDTCAATAVASIERTGTLECFSHLFPHDNRSLPSFVPNWTGSYEWNDLYRFRFDCLHFFDASAGRAAEYVVVSQSAMRLRGVFFDVVTAEMSICPNDDGHLEWPILAVLFVATGAAILQEEHCSIDIERALILWSTLMNGLECIVENSLAVRRILSGQRDLSGVSKLLEFVSTPVEERVWDNEIRQIVANIVQANFGRKVVVTSGGHLGLAPKSCGVGDTIAVLLGGKVPYVLRRNQAQQELASFQILGDAYVHGIMSGEALFHPNGEEKELEDILLV